MWGTGTAHRPHLARLPGIQHSLQGRAEGLYWTQCQGPQLLGKGCGLRQGAVWRSVEVCYTLGGVLSCRQAAAWSHAAATAGRPAPAAAAYGGALPCAAPPAHAT